MKFFFSKRTMGVFAGIILVLVLGGKAGSFEERYVSICGRSMGYLTPSEKPRLDPRVAFVSKDGVVTFVNRIRVLNVRIIFEETMPCQKGTKGSSGFEFEGAKPCNFVRELGELEKLSIRFPEAGTYTYTINPSTGRDETGRVIVK